jgi:hypothetical protein
MDNPRYDIALGAVFALIGIGLLVPSYQEGARVFLLPGDISPYFVPKVFLYSWIAVSLAILVKGIRDLPGNTHAPAAHRWGKIIAVFVACVCATALMKPLGYMVVAPVAVYLSVWMLGYRNHLLNVIVSLVVSLSLYLLLVQLAGLSLPQPFWTLK